MTDIEKIRAEVERLQDFTMDENKNFYSEAAEGEYNALCNIEHFIDSLQEEPVSIDFEQELYKAFGQVKDFTLGMRIAKWFYDMGKNSHKQAGKDFKQAIKEK